MRIDMQIALCFDFQVNQAVPCHLIEHVIKKRHTGRQPGLTGTVQIHPDKDPGLKGISADFGLPHESLMTKDVLLVVRPSQARRQLLREALPRPEPAARGL